METKRWEKARDEYVTNFKAERAKNPNWLPLVWVEKRNWFEATWLSDWTDMVEYLLEVRDYNPCADGDWMKDESVEFTTRTKAEYLASWNEEYEPGWEWEQYKLQAKYYIWPTQDATIAKLVVDGWLPENVDIRVNVDW